jgi:hypothetical protein
MTPAILQTTLASALARSDRYVWFYVEGPTYLRPEAQGGASQAWVDAVAAVVPVEEAAPPPPAPPPPPASPDPTTSSTSAEARSSCGLLGMEAVLLFPILAWARRRRRR